MNKPGTQNDRKGGISRSSLSLLLSQKLAPLTAAAAMHVGYYCVDPLLAAVAAAADFGVDR